MALSNPPDSPLLLPVFDEILSFHSAVGIDISHMTPAPMLIENGWADDYTPPEIGGIRMYRYLRSLNPDANVALQFADWGHPRSKDKLADGIAIHNQGIRFMDHYVRGIGTAPAPGSVTAYTQTCTNSQRSLGPFEAPSWQALHPGEVRFGDDTPVTITDASSNPPVDAQLDPATATPCATISGNDGLGVAVYRHRMTRQITSLGLPTVDLDVTTIGPYGRLIAKLFDEAPDGTRTLITRGVYRLTSDQTGHVTFQLFGGGWRFEPGHTARLEIAGADVPFFKPAEAPFTAQISNVRIALPTYEQPDGGEIQPNSHLGPRERVPSGTAATALATVRCASRRAITVHIRPSWRRSVVRAVVFLEGKVVKRLGAGHFAARIVLRGRTRGTAHVRILARLRDGRRVVNNRTYHPCVRGPHHHQPRPTPKQRERPSNTR